MEILVHLQKVSDTRSHVNQDYPVLEMSFLLINALISGSKSWADIHVFGETRLDWFRQYLPFEHGIPTQQNVARIIRTMVPESLMAALVSWVNAVREESQFQLYSKILELPLDFGLFIHTVFFGVDNKSREKVSLPNVSLPLGPILSPFVEKISKYFFEPSLKTSHEYYTRWQNSYDNWQSLNDQVDVSVFAPHALDNQKVPFVKLAFKLKENAKNVELLQLFVESSGTYLNHQDSITIRNLEGKVVVASLPSTPLRSLDIADSGKGVLFSLRKIEVNEVGSNSSLSNNKVCFDFSNVDLLNDRFVKKWDAFWNMRAIDSAYSHIKQILRYHLVSQKVYYSISEEVPKKELFKAILRYFVGRPLNWILSRHFLVCCYFWFPIFLRKKELDASGKNVFTRRKD